MVTVHYRQWRPPQSPLRIEFPPELLHDVRKQDFQKADAPPIRWVPRWNRAIHQTSGLLFGTRHENDVRLLAAEADGESGAAHPEGLARLGTFVCRERGEVFLTDDDLADFERHEGILALVVAGGRAGFFVREPDGSVQAIHSHEEFEVADAAAQPVSQSMAAAAELPAPPPRWKHAWKRAAACAGLLAVPAGGFAYLRPMLPRLPIALSLREEAGQVVIGWNASALTEGGRLEILDGGERTILMLEPNTSSASYRLQSSDVEVRLSTENRTGGARWEAARFVAKAPRGSRSASFALQERIGQLAREAETLRHALAEGQARTKALAAKLEALTAPRPEP